MSDLQVAIPTRQQLAAVGRSAPGRVTGRLKVAIDAMVWEGMKRADAAAKAGLQEQSLYVALCRPHVRTYYLKQLEVLRTSERARNIHTLAEVRDQTSNQMARVQAVKALEQLDDAQQSAPARHVTPGLVVIIGDAAHTARLSGVPDKPLITLDQTNQESMSGGEGAHSLHRTREGGGG